MVDAMDKAGVDSRTAVDTVQWRFAVLNCSKHLRITYPRDDSTD